MRRTRAAMRVALASACLLGAWGVTWAQGQAVERLFALDQVVQGAEKADRLRAPRTVAVSPDGEIAAGDVHGKRLVIFGEVDGEWRVKDRIALPGAPIFVRHDGERFIVSMRDGAGLIAVEGPRHQTRKLSLPADAVPGALAVVPGGGFYVVDYLSGDLLRFNPSGAAAGRIEVGERITGLAVMATGRLYAVIAERAEIRVFGEDGSEQGRIEIPGQSPLPAWPAGIAVEPDGQLVLTDRHAGRIVVLDGRGAVVGVGSRAGWEPGLLRFPADLDRFEDGRIVVADEGNGRLQIFRRLP